MRVRAMLVAAALLVAAAGAGVAWVAANDDSGSPEGLSSVDPREAADPPESSRSPQPAPSTDPAPSAETPTEAGPAPPADAGPDAEATPPSSRQSSAPETKRRTHFKREPKGAARNDRPQRTFGVPPAHEFTGEGTARLGTVDVKAPSILRWRTRGRLEVRFGREAFPILAPTSSGQLELPPFRFEEVRVIARGRWRITITPR